MALRYSLEPADEAFLASAPWRASETFEIRRPAAEVWLDLTRDGALDWCRLLSGAQWTSPRPFGVGTTRQMKVKPVLMVVDETFFIWEEGHRKAFYVTSSNMPLNRRLAEDYVVEETGPGACRFTWTVAVEPAPIGRPGKPIHAAVTRSFFADTRRHFGAN